MDHPYFHILGHPTCRLIGQRPPLDLDMEKLMLAAKERGCILEINAQPDRLDLNDVYCRLAKETGVLLAISTDAHSESDLQFMKQGISTARRGWIESKDVINTRSWSEIAKLIGSRGSSAKAA
jgi:DNA polymerase (family 10)